MADCSPAERRISRVIPVEDAENVGALLELQTRDEVSDSLKDADYQLDTAYG